jgi:hypothetical protein
MQSQLSFYVSIAFSFIAWGIITARYVWPEFRVRPRAEALRRHCHVKVREDGIEEIFGGCPYC